MTALKNGKEVTLYSNSKFGAVGTIELVDNAIPKVRSPTIYKNFTSEVDQKGIPIFHSSAIPVTFYEAIPTDAVSFEIHVTGFIGSIWVEATENDTINLNAFKKAGKPFGSWTQGAENGTYSGVIPYGSNLSVGSYK